MTMENTIKAFLLNQIGIIIVRNMSSTDRRRQNRSLRRIITTAIMTEEIVTTATMVVTPSGADENKEKQRPSGMVTLSERHVDFVTTATTRSEQHSQTRKSCINTILSILNCVAVKDLFARPSAVWCLCTCINVSDLLY